MSVRGGLLLLEVAKQEKIEVDEADIEAEIGKITASMGSEAERVTSLYRDPDARERLRYRLLEDKVVKFLLEKSERTDASA